LASAIVANKNCYLQDVRFRLGGGRFVSKETLGFDWLRGPVPKMLQAM